MKLANTSTFEVSYFPDPTDVRYVYFSYALSSPRDNSRRPYQSLAALHGLEHTPTEALVDRACLLARDHGYQWIWIDVLCVDKESALDVSETINSLPSYLQGSALCFAYLDDLACGPSPPSEDSLKQCRFWTESWTLPELVLPPKVLFYDSHFHRRGQRSAESFPRLLAGITAIDEEVLASRATLQEISIAKRMSWAACRKPYRPEDTVYAALGIFGVCMPVLYGEGERRALRRLQEAILRNSNDMSVLAWTSLDDSETRGAFAHSFQEYWLLGQMAIARDPFSFDGFVIPTSNGLRIHGQFASQETNLLLDLGSHPKDRPRENRVGLLLTRSTDGTFTRSRPTKLQALPADQKTETLRIMFSYDQRPSDNDSNSAFISDCKTPKSSPVSDSQAQDMPLRPFGATASYVSRDFATCGMDSNPAKDTDWVHLSKNIPQDHGGAHLGDSIMSSGYLPHEDRPDSPLSFTSRSSTAPSSLGSELNDTFQCLGHHRYSAVMLNGPLDSSVTNDEGDVEFPSMSTTRSATPATPSELSKSLLDGFQDWTSAQHRLARHHSRRPKTITRLPQRQNNPRKRHNGKGFPLEYACPFFRYDPESYSSCLADHSLRTFAHVKDHIWDDHRLPYYCPRCNENFNLAAQRDEHIVGRTCGLEDPVERIGVTGEQRIQADDIRGSADGRARWLELWAIVFPETCPDGSPYLDRGRELKVANLRAFWRTRGRALLHKKLEAGTNGAPVGEESAEVESLLSRALADAIRNTMGGSDLGSQHTFSSHV